MKIFAIHNFYQRPSGGGCDSHSRQALLRRHGQTMRLLRQT